MKITYSIICAKSTLYLLITVWIQCIATIFVVPTDSILYNFLTYSTSQCQSTIFYRTISQAPETLDFHNKTKLFRTFLMGELNITSYHYTCFSSSKCRHIYYVRAWNAVGNLLYKMNGVWFGWQFVMLNGWEFVLSCNMYFRWKSLFHEVIICVASCYHSTKCFH